MTQTRPTPRTVLIRLKPLLAALMVVLLFFAVARPATAAGQGHDALFDALRMEEMVEVLAQEGQMIAEDFDAQGLAVPRDAWADMLGRLYSETVMKAAFRTELSRALDGADTTPMVAFYESDLGQKIAALELDARRAMSGEEAQDLAAEAWAALDVDDPRVALIEEYVETYDLVEMNVAGSMTSDYAYLSAFSRAGGDNGGLMSDEDILREIWSYEDDARAEVSEWVYGFSTLAYEPLTDAEFRSYLEFARTDAGQKLNNALFGAFDAVYTEISRGLGTGTALLMSRYSGEEL